MNITTVLESQKTKKKFTLEPGKPQKKKKKNRKKKGKKTSAAKVYRAPVKEYVSKCCNATAKKPRTGSPLGSSESVDAVHGLGGWRCSTCNKACKVTPRAIEVKPA